MCRIFIGGGNPYKGLVALLARRQIEEEHGICGDDTVLLSVGELNENKNHRAVIEALGMIKKSDEECVGHLHYFIAGKGSLWNELIELADKLGVNLHLLGFRNDMPELLAAADIFILPSIREGLNVSLMEAMASGLPCIVSKIRGNVDLIDEGKGGWLVADGGSDEYADLIGSTMQEKNGLRRMGEYNRKKIETFDSAHISNIMKRIYQEDL